MQPRRAVHLRTVRKRIGHRPPMIAVVRADARSRARRHPQGLLQLALLPLQLLNLPLLRRYIDVAGDPSGIELHVDRSKLALRLVDLALQPLVFRFRHVLALASGVQLGGNAVEIRPRGSDALVIAIDLAIELKLLILQVLVLRPRGLEFGVCLSFPAGQAAAHQVTLLLHVRAARDEQHGCKDQQAAAHSLAPAQTLDTASAWFIATTFRSSSAIWPLRRWICASSSRVSPPVRAAAF